MNLDVTVKWSKSATEVTRADLAQPMAVATAFAQHLRDRATAGKFATTPEAYKDKPTSGPRRHKAYYISPYYAEKCGLGKQTRFASSREMHAALPGGHQLGNVTGEMWKGLQVRNWGDDGVIVEFGGSSLGAKSTLTAITKRKAGEYEVTLSGNGKLRAKQVRELSRDEGGNVKYRRKPKLVRNNLKAYAVFQYLRIGLLQPTDAELAAAAAAVRNHADIIVRGRFGAALGGAEQGAPSGTMRLYQAMMAGFRK